MKQKLKKVLQFLLNPRLLLCLGLGWMITNGWSYVLMGIGTWLGNEWMMGVAGSYLALLWVPMTPEKIITVAIAIGLLRWLFPRDQKTLKVLKNMYAKAKRALKRRKRKGEKLPDRKGYIAVFDSGVGGISVLRELVKELPGEKFLYYGDCANAPYGVRPTEEVKELTMAAAEMLFDRKVKALVVACNTATAAAINDLRKIYPDKIVVGIEPALKVAADNFPKGRVGVMATPVTLGEEKFANLSGHFPDMQVSPIPAPGLVELIEKGSEKEELKAFLTPLLESYVNRLDVLVLGCTHYPFAAQAIREILGEEVVLLDGGRGTARQTRRRLEEEDLLAEGEGQVLFETSLADPDFETRANMLLNNEDR